MATGGKITVPFRQITQLNLISFLRHNIRRPLSHDCLGPATTWNTLLPNSISGRQCEMTFVTPTHPLAAIDVMIIVNVRCR